MTGYFEGLIDNLALGLWTALSPTNLYYCFLGVILGKFVGVLPGIGALVALSLLLPITFHIHHTAAIVMLAGVYYGSTYGGSVSSILLNIPGTPATAVTCLEGYPMSRQGRAGVALFMTTVASFFGASIGIVIMTLFSPLIVEFSLSFGPAEYFALMLLGLVAASSITTGAPAKGIAMVLLGVLLGLVGSDIETGQERYTFGVTELFDGLPLVAVALGLFGVAEVIYSVRTNLPGTLDRKSITFRSMVPTRDDIRRSIMPMVRGTGIGSFLGALPGTGAVIASFMAYAVEKKVAKDPTRFGNGAIEGIMGPESAANAADQTAFIPTMTLGIPGNVVMALMIGALTIHGIVPGPQLMVKEPELFWGVLMSFWVGNLMLLFLSVPLIGVWVRNLNDPVFAALSRHPVVRGHRCLQRQQQYDRRDPGRSAGRRRLCHAASRFPAGAVDSRLRARAADGGKLPPHHADRARRLHGVFRAADQRHTDGADDRDVALCAVEHVAAGPPAARE